MVIANVFGFHRRGDASEPGERLTLFMNSRSNPFNPFITLLPKLTFRIDLKLAEIYFKSQFSKDQGKRIEQAAPPAEHN